MNEARRPGLVRPPNGQPLGGHNHRTGWRHRGPASVDSACGSLATLSGGQYRRDPMQSEPDYRELVERAGDMIYTLDLAGAFTYMNAAGLGILGYTADELMGRHFGDVLTPASAELALEHFQRGIDGTESTPFFEVQAVRKDGVLVDVVTRAVDLYRDVEMVGR